MFIVLVNDKDAILREITHIGAERDVAETHFIATLRANITNWEEYSVKDVADILSEGYEKLVGGGAVMLIDTDGFTSDELIRDELTNQPHSDMTISKVIQTGELELRVGMTVDEIVAQCATNLDAACSWDIQGQVLFKGSDDKWYTITTESVIGEASPEFIDTVLADLREEIGE